MMKKFSADYIFPISSPPIKNGIIVINDDGKILDVLPPSPSADGEGLGVRHLQGIICPGFINTHCHLDLSYLKNKIPEKTGLVDFIKHIEQNRKANEEEVQQAIIDAENAMIEDGIVAVGDISNGNTSFSQKTKSKLKYHTFIEALGFHPDKADLAFKHCLKLFEQLKNLNLPSSIVPHAPYSISKKLFEKITAFANEHSSILTIHNQENAAENKMFQDGSGEIFSLLKDYFKMDCSFWKVTGKTSLQSVLPFFPKGNKLQLVHNTFTAKEDFVFLKSQILNPKSQIYFCFCPNANLYIENRLPDFQIFIDEKVKITIGTDSLASNHQLSILEELKTISQYAPQIPLENLLQWGTLNGAEFLGFEKELGSIEVGKKPGLVLIENVDLEKMKFTPLSKSRKL